MKYIKVRVFFIKLLNCSGKTIKYCMESKCIFVKYLRDESGCQLCSKFYRILTFWIHLYFEKKNLQKIYNKFMSQKKFWFSRNLMRHLKIFQNEKKNPPDSWLKYFAFKNKKTEIFCKKNFLEKKIQDFKNYHSTLFLKVLLRFQSDTFWDIESG